jgi:AGCS family alanine or glycine:cation symporter
VNLSIDQLNVAIANLVAAINSVVWSPALVYLALGVGLYFSLRTRFLQVRHFREMLRLTFSTRSSDAGVSSFQALAMSLSGRVGTGNIAGVATAITFGGPGAVFWMWTVAFLGSGTAFVESVLGQIYKEERRGQFRGGPAFYIEKGIGKSWFAWTFAVVTIIACGFLLPGVQSNSIAKGIEHALGVPKWITAVGVAALLGLIIWGGVKRIAHFAQIAVPFMALSYILVALAVVALNIHRVPEIFRLIVSSAFGLEAGFGAVLGLAIQWGVKRGIYSNEAGQGSGPHPASAALVNHPAEQGLVQAFSVYIDTLLVCSATAFMLLITGKYNVEGPDGTFLVNGLPGVEAGPAYTQSAVESVFPGLGSLFVAIALFFFAFTTLIAYYYIAETNVAYINRRFERPYLIQVLRVTMMIAVVYSAVRTAHVAWGLGDIGVATMAWLNLIAILWLQKPALAALTDYERQRCAGGEIRFRPSALNIGNATFWEQEAAQQSRSRSPDN